MPASNLFAGLIGDAGLPMPLRWFRCIRARESEDGDRYCFDVSAALPLLGHFVSYRGWLVTGAD